jgi:hypothetical protein
MDVRRVIDYLKAELRKVDTAIESLEAAIEGSLAAEQKRFVKNGYTMQTSHPSQAGLRAVRSRARENLIDSRRDSQM